MSDPFAQALHDFHFEEMHGPLLYRRGEETQAVEVDFYIEEFTADGSWLESWIEGGALDMGAGAGRHSLYFQDRVETVAVERPETLVWILRDRGVTDVRQADMFTLPDSFEADRFRSAIALGIQVGLSRSMGGLRQFLDDHSHVTTTDATLVIDGYDPDHQRTREKFDYHENSTDSLVYRILQMEYDGTLGEPWLYRLFTLDRVREAATDTDWEIPEARYDRGDYYHPAVRKQ